MELSPYVFKPVHHPDGFKINQNLSELQTFSFDLRCFTKVLNCLEITHLHIVLY